MMPAFPGLAQLRPAFVRFICGVRSIRNRAWPNKRNAPGLMPVQVEFFFHVVRYAQHFDVVI